MLSIVVITMNRAEQLRSALLSCTSSKLPNEVEFVIIDNASTDNTKNVVYEFFAEHQYPFVYEKEEVNLGVGGGRNRGFELAQGEFVYFLDDDAVISPESYETFFKLPLSLFYQDETIASITTRIYDEMLECDRAVQYSKTSSKDSLPKIFMYLGGSHFLRKCYYDRPLYLDFKYGMEELLPSIYAIDKGQKNCYIHQIKILHQPRRNKWNSNENERNDIIADYNVNSYISKRLIYPSIFLPLLNAAFYVRTIRCFGWNRYMWKKSKQKLKTHRQNIYVKVRKVKVKTVLLIMKNYSFGSAF